MTLYNSPLLNWLFGIPLFMQLFYKTALSLHTKQVFGKIFFFIKNADNDGFDDE